MPHDPRISEIFYYFEKHTTIASGRTVGRKIGVVQEILCNKLLLTSEKIRDSVVYEPKIPGYSGATHKVEFVLFQPSVVVEVSPSQTFAISPQLSATVTNIDFEKQSAKISLSGEVQKRRTVRAGRVLRINEFLADSALLVKIVTIDAEKVRFAVLDALRPVASIESKRVGAQRFSGHDQLGSGIQTIEKAKQASLVAIDFDLKFNGVLLAQSSDPDKREFRSFVVLGNGVHWTAHDLAVLETYVDYTYLVADDAVLRYAEFVRTLSARDNEEFFPYFMRYFQGMTKTPPDAFAVSGDDFVAVRPDNAGPLLKAVEEQLLPYNVSVL